MRPTLRNISRIKEALTDEFLSESRMQYASAYIECEADHYIGSPYVIELFIALNGTAVEV